jgi:hypothetical protein
VSTPKRDLGIASQYEGRDFFLKVFDSDEHDEKFAVISMEHCVPLRLILELAERVLPNKGHALIKIESTVVIGNCVVHAPRDNGPGRLSENKNLVNLSLHAMRNPFDDDSSSHSSLITMPVMTLEFVVSCLRSRFGDKFSEQEICMDDQNFPPVGLCISMRNLT